MPTIIKEVVHKPLLIHNSTKPQSVLYTVKSGDTLSGIARTMCGEDRDWSGIYLSNKIKIGRDPDTIVDGQRLYINCKHPLVRIPDPVTNSGSKTSVTQLAPAPAHIGQGGGFGGNLSYSGLEALWRSAGGAQWAAATAACIAENESGGNQFALSPTNDYGYWQINISNGALATFNAYGNARAAIILSNNGSNWSAWTTHGMCGV